MHLVIGNKAYSSWSLRPWVYLKHQGIEFEEQRVPLFQGDFKAELLRHSPAGKVPVLLDGPLRVWDSLAILEYLAEKYADKPGWPSEAAARALARSVSAEMHSGFGAMREHLGMNIRRRYAPRAWPEEVAADLARVCGLWEDCRARFGEGGPFLFGRFSIADAMYAPVAFRFRTYAVELGGASREYCDRLLDLAAMREWVAGARAESEVIEKYELPA